MHIVDIVDRTFVLDQLGVPYEAAGLPNCDVICVRSPLVNVVDTSNFTKLMIYNLFNVTWSYCVHVFFDICTIGNE